MPTQRGKWLAFLRLVNDCIFYGIGAACDLRRACGYLFLEIHLHIDSID